MNRTAFGLLLAALLCSAFAQETLPAGGSSFETATEIEPGYYVLGHDIESGASEFFKLSGIKPGQKVVIEFSGEGYPELALFDEDREVLWDETLMDEKETIFWTAGSQKDVYNFLIRLGAFSGKCRKGTTVKIAVEDHFDAGTGTDLSDSLDGKNVLEIEQGEYEGYLAGEKGDDHRDFYKIYLDADDTLSVRVTPPSNRERAVEIYNEDGELLTSGESANEGAIAKATYTATKGGYYYIAVSSYAYGSSLGTGEYTLNVAVEKSNTGAKTQTETTSEGYNQEYNDQNESGGLNPALLALVVLIAAGAGFYFLKSSKK